ncbi:MAG: hypothetical protein EZS28_019462 [Streblomastix strix]|uniref:Uncharacterized protein n=1 Tax=Streblomastix strix TaxID=222440 RepID=A0A5J4VRI7_9EUKA|nr:MAG: hypothetical protein EZS28_019462 [Streblomastix strix]
MENKEIKEQKKPRKKVYQKSEAISGASNRAISGASNGATSGASNGAISGVISGAQSGSSKIRKAQKILNRRRGQRKREIIQEAVQIETEKNKKYLIQEDQIKILEIIEGGPKEQTDDVSN